MAANHLAMYEAPENCNAEILNEGPVDHLQDISMKELSKIFLGILTLYIVRDLGPISI